MLLIISNLININFFNSSLNKEYFLEIPIKNYKIFNLRKIKLIINHPSKNLNKKVLPYNIQTSQKRNNKKQIKDLLIKIQKNK